MRNRPIPLRSLTLALFAVASTLATTPAARAQSGTWTNAGLSPNPGHRREYGAVFDRENQRYFLFQGLYGTSPYYLVNDVWSLSVAGAPAWSQLTFDGAVPGPRASPQWGYDPARNRVLVFGGYGLHYPDSPYFEYLDDVWELALDGTPQWTELTPAGQAPVGRLAGAAVFDPMRQRFVGFGGTRGMPVDTWVLNLRGEANWEPLPVGDGVRPNGGYGMMPIYDGKRDRMVIFGGSTSDDYYGATNEVWELDLRGLPTWHQVVTTGTAPIPRRDGTAIYDALRDRLVVYGGFDAVAGSDQFLGDVWALDFTSDPPSWSQLLPAGTNPVGRDAPAAVYDPIHDRMIFYGGWSGTSMLDDTEFLDWGGSSVEASLAPSSSSATPTSAHVEWNVSQATGSYAAVYRKDPGGLWSALAEGVVDGTGKLTYDDATVLAGNDYQYMMVVGSHRGETFGGSVSVTVPPTTGVGNGRASFALAGASPNPAYDRMSVGFTLTSAAPARLELVDVTGRRITSRDVGVLGAGEHRIDLETAGQAPPGIYFLRLTQAGHVASSRVAIAGTR